MQISGTVRALKSGIGFKKSAQSAVTTATFSSHCIPTTTRYISLEPTETSLQTLQETKKHYQDFNLKRQQNNLFCPRIYIK